jgi:hypothetical protein
MSEYTRHEAVVSHVSYVADFYAIMYVTDSTTPPGVEAGFRPPSPDAMIFQQDRMQLG